MFSPALPAPAQQPQPSPNVNQKIKIPHPGAPAEGEYDVDADKQTVDGPWRHLRGNVRVETADMLVKADVLDWNTDTGDMEARGHVHYVNFDRGETIDCDRLEYNTDQETGKFYNVHGTSNSQIQARPGLLTTQNPFYFQAKWAERIGDHYVLHDGLLTDCVVPDAWWVLKAPQFELYPGDHAIAHDAWFYLRGIRIMFIPYFYKSLKKEPRRSGFLLPDIGTSSLHGEMVGFGYYWAINRSMDLTYRGIYYTGAGLANYVEMRAKLNDNSGFDLNIFGVEDTQQTVPTSSGIRIDMVGNYNLGDGWEARGQLDYLSSFNFLQQFTQSFNEAVFSETDSVGFVTKHWQDFGVDFVSQRDVDFEPIIPGQNEQTIEIRKLPSAEVNEREHEIDVDNWPFWVSFEGSAGLLDRTEPLYQTPLFVDRLDFAPHVSTAFRWHDIQIIPTFGIRETQYSDSLGENSQSTPFVAGNAILRNERDVTVDMIFPSLEHIFDHPPKWMGEKVKHVIEPRVTYKYVNGIDNFNDIIRFDSTDILADTNQVELSLTNRLIAKDKNGNISDLLSWQVRWDRYFDPTFGGAVIPGQRNVIAPEIDLTGFAFLDGPRAYSPVSSVLRVQSRVNLEWQLDYDPLTKRLANSSVSVDGRIQKWFWGFGLTSIDEPTVLEPRADQIHTRIGYGNPNSRGWNTGSDVYYDLKLGSLQWWDAQVTYNTDCCGFSVQFRRINFGSFVDSQWQGSFAISNIGSFGTLKRQQSIF